MEFLLVKFRESRLVIIDGHQQGSTNKVIELVGGRHAVTLDGKSDFTPTEQSVVINATSVVTPYVLYFD